VGIGEVRRRTIAIERSKGGGEIAALEYGPPDRALDILFLHANGFNAGTYRQALAPLGATLRVLAVDMRGHGRTNLPTPIEGHAWRIYADDLLALLSALGEVPRVLAGHSMGGTTALLAAPRIAKMQATTLVLFDPVVAARAAYDNGDAPDWDQPLARGALRRKSTFATRLEAAAAYRGRGAFKTWPDTMLDDYLEDGLKSASDGSFTLACAPAWEAANFACYASSNPFAGFDGAGGAVRVLRAESGSTCSVTEAEAAVHWPSVRVETVAGTTHFLPMERPDLLREALRGSLPQIPETEQIKLGSGA
jgi:pimeloyl-ACP methyl ester carboxylesterase